MSHGASHSLGSHCVLCLLGSCNGIYHKVGSHISRGLILCKHILGPKMMIIQGVRYQKSYYRVCDANDLQKRGGEAYDARICA